MEKGDKSSPSPGQNIFDTSSLLGASPFAAGLSALPFAHLSHIPSAFSMLGHHPAFPVTSLFGRIDGLGSPLMSPTSSLSQSLSPTSATIRSSLFTSSPSPTSSSTETKVSTATASRASTSTNSSRNDSGSSRRKGGPGSRGRPRKLQKQPAIPLSLVSGAYKSTGTILSPSQLLKQRQRESNGTNGLETDNQSDTSTSSLHGDGHLEKESKHERKTSPSKQTILNAPKSPTKILSANNSVSLLSQAPHIDGLKKRLIADQIRQRVQNKAQSSNSAPMSPPTQRTRGRGRPPKNSQQKNMSPDELEQQQRRQEELKRQLEAELKQQQIALRMMKKANSMKDKEKTSTSSSSSSTSSLSSSSPPKVPPLTIHLNKHKPHESKLAQALSPSKQDVSPSTSKQKTSEPIVAKFKKLSKDGSSISSTGETDGSESDSDSDSDSSTGTASDNADDGDASRSGSEITNKRPHESDSHESSLGQVKRRRVVLDETELRVPLEQGWKRQTNIHTYGRRGIVGEVWYFAPCGRKLKTIPDVMRYLDRNSVTSLGRDNFSFNTKVHVGEFFEARQGENGFVKLTESEIDNRLSATVSRRRKKMECQRKQEKLQMQQMLAKQLMEAKLKQKIEQQEMARKVAEMQFQKRLDKQRQKDMMKRAKQMRLLEKRKQKEQQRLMKEQEKIQRQEQLRMEREMRAQQIMENRRKQREEKEQRKYVEAVRKAQSNLLWFQLEQEREMKRQQAAMLKEQVRLKQERERRRQHLLLLKALEQRKKQEDRERLREEKIAEKRMNKERKVEQRKMEFVLAQELKKPREDMELRDFKEMPELPRIPGNRLEGNTFADILMVLEFLHNFGSALGFDDETLPTLKSLQDGVINKTDEDGEEYISLVSHLMRYALDDPGVPNPKEAVTPLGQKIVDMEVMDNVLSEILRIYMVGRNGREEKISTFLKDHPVEACSVEDRAAILAFLCNELNCSKNITGEIEKQLDHMGDIRRDKWVVEGKLRRLRVIQARKFKRPAPKPAPEADSSVTGDGEDSMTNNNTPLASKQNSDDEEEKENPEENDSGNESDPGTSNKDGDNLTEAEEEDPATLEECEKKIEKLQKQHAQYRDKVFEASHKIRAVTFGQDRYKRRYWVLTCAGGIFVEGMESGELPEHTFDEPEGKSEEEKCPGKEEEMKDVSEEKSAVKSEIKIEVKEEIKSAESEEKMDTNPDVKMEQIVNGEEKMEVDAKCDSESEVKMEIEVKPKVKDEENVEVKMEVSPAVMCEMKPESQLETKPIINGDLEKECVIKESLPDLEMKDVKKFNGFEHSEEKGTKTDIKDHILDLEDKIMKQEGSDSGERTFDSVLSKIHSAVENAVHHSNVELKIPNVKSCAIDKAGKDEVSNMFLQQPSSNKLSELCNMSPNSLIKMESSMVVNNAHVTSPTPSSIITATSVTNSSNNIITSTHHGSAVSSPKPPPAHSKTSTPLVPKPNFMSIDSILKKESASSVQSNQFFPPGILPLSPFTDVLKPTRDSTDQRPWFSILPRVPCDDMSLTRGQHQSLSPAMLTSSPYMPQIPFRGFSLHSPSFSSLQMGQLFGSPSDFNISGRSSVASNVSSTSLNDSFKVPEIPGNYGQSSQQGPDPEEVLRTLQGEAKPIPEEYQKGWWKINTVDELRQLQKCLHPRGIREKSLQKTIQKFSDYAVASLTKADKEVICLESSSESEESEDESEETKSKSTHNASKKSKDEKSEKEDDKDEKKKTDSTEKEEEDKPKEKKKVENPKPVIDTDAKVHESDMAVLDEVESLEDRIASASLQIKGWKLAARTAMEESHITVIPRNQSKTSDSQCYPLESAKDRLLQLEANVERRYLKPPLCKAQKISLTSLTTSHDDKGDDVENEVLPAGLQTWRNAVNKATSPAQIMLCIHQLNKSISWEKSIMKVLCQICRKDDNEAELLLCDGCDRGYHTYCFKPKLESIPDGDWYCFECISKAVGESCCIVCGKRMGRLVECSSCPRAVHIDCMDPPLSRVPRKWFCASCQEGKGKKRSRKSSTASATSTPSGNTSTSNSRKRKSDASTAQQEAVTPKKEAEKSPEKKKGGQLDKEKRKQAEASTDMVICRLALTEMEKHEDGWPFLQPVNCKEFTSYKKYIKHPMDFSTMKNKLRDNCYKMRSDFVSDAHLVFDNCKTFNEDDSEVGQCGHSMRKFFEKRWKELLISSMNEDNSKKETHS